MKAISSKCVIPNVAPYKCYDRTVSVLSLHIAMQVRLSHDLREIPAVSSSLEPYVFRLVVRPLVWYGIVYERVSPFRQVFHIKSPLCAAVLFTAEFIC